MLNHKKQALTSKNNVLPNEIAYVAHLFDEMVYRVQNVDLIFLFFIELKHNIKFIFLTIYSKARVRVF